MIPNVEETKSREIEEIVERIASKMDGRTVTSHEHYREMLAKELVYELNSHHQDMMSEVVEIIEKKRQSGVFPHEYSYNQALDDIIKSLSK